MPQSNPDEELQRIGFISIIAGIAAGVLIGGNIFKNRHGHMNMDSVAFVGFPVGVILYFVLLRNYERQQNTIEPQVLQ